MMRCETATLSKAGGRKNNQDSCGFKINHSAGCWIVADGLGGHAGGETASRMAVDAVLEVFEESGIADLSDFIVRGFEKAQQLICLKAAQDYLLSSMRTTMVVLGISQQQALWAHVGDSRLYWFREGKIVFQTRDHSVPQLLADAGKIGQHEVRGHEEQNRLTRAVGQQGNLKPTISEKMESVLPGDLALLCSDGIWTHVTESEMEDAWGLSTSCPDWLNKLEEIVLARGEGEFDNYTAIAVRFAAFPAP